MRLKARRFRPIEGMGLTEAICPVCGKKFVMLCATEWVYKVRGRKVCSYGCMRKES